MGKGMYSTWEFNKSSQRNTERSRTFVSWLLFVVSLSSCPVYVSDSTLTDRHNEVIYHVLEIGRRKVGGGSP